MIRSRIILILICSSVLYCCNKSSKTEEKVIQEKVKDTTIYKVSKDTTIKRESSARVYFTKNPIILKSNIFNLDSLDRFFKFKDIDRIDKLDTVLFTWYEDSLKEIVFPSRIIKPMLSEDSIHLGYYQFLIGNVGRKSNEINYILILDYIDSWGSDLKLVSIDKEGEILDIIPMSERFGDGGDFIRTRVYWVGESEYRFKTTCGFETFTDPDTIFYKETFGTKKIMDGGKLITDVIKIDSNQIKIINE